MALIQKTYKQVHYELTLYLSTPPIHRKVLKNKKRLDNFKIKSYLNCDGTKSLNSKWVQLL